MERESMEFDVVIVGAGPAGLAAAVRLRQLSAEHGREIAVCVVEKGSEVGAHILSGAVLDPRALDELIPDWKDRGAPLNTPARDDRLLLLTRRRAFRLPIPPQMRNRGNYIISLGTLCRWLGVQAEALGTEIYAGFAAAEVLYDGDGAVVGVATGDMGLGRDGRPTANHQPGVELRAKYTLFADGCRGSLNKALIERFPLDDRAQPPTSRIGTTGRGVTIHTIDCEILESFTETPDRWLDVAWEIGEESDALYLGRVKLEVTNEPGSLGSLSMVIAKNLGNISNLKITNRSTDFFEILVDIEVQDVKHLTKIITALRTTATINSAERSRG